MKHKRIYSSLLSPLFLVILTISFCWLFCGRYGVFGSKVDWISQHSVFPDYFRQQFYDTGDFFPEFSLNIGGGQNIYHFSYYGLYSPIFWLSYLLPFVKMSDYLIAASVTCLASAVVVFYCWLKRHGFSQVICFGTALMFLLAGPMIYQSYNQVLFILYMPFLCMALWGVDLFLEKGQRILYISGVFLMILTSFYFSIGGILVLLLYGLHRYWILAEGTERSIGVRQFFQDGIRFVLPILTAVLCSAFLLVPAAAAMTGGREASAAVIATSLFLPTFKLSAVLYHPYGIGLTTFSLTVLIAGMRWKRRGERILVWGLLLILTIPLVWYLLNGGLYIREKVLIPCLPLLCYLIACYLKKQLESPASFWRGFLPYLLSIVLVFFGNMGSLSVTLRPILILDAGIMAVCDLIFWKVTHRKQKARYAKFFRKGTPILCFLLPSVLFLFVYQLFFHRQADTFLSHDFYENITECETRQAVDFITDRQEFVRMEQLGTSSEGFADQNRIWNVGQYSTSVYSSLYHSEYQNFRTQIFGVEEPHRNFLMQPASRNPIFQRFMGIRYLISQEEIPGYEWEGTVTDKQIWRNDQASPIAYATDRLLNQKTYESLPFPWNQTTLLDYAVVEAEGRKKAPSSDSLDIQPGTLFFPALQKPGNHLTQNGQTIQAALKNPETVSFNLAELFPEWTDTQQREQDHVIFLQFSVDNQKPTSDVSITMEKERNKLSTSSHIYQNHNTTFTYAVPIQAGQSSVSLTLGKGSYQLSEIQLFGGTWKEKSDMNSLYQSKFQADTSATKGNQIKGTIETISHGYFITTIPYDTHFEIVVDGTHVTPEKVNTAFLGFPLKAGGHRIEITYHAPGAAAGKLLSLLGVFFCFFHLKSDFQHSKQTSRRIEI